MNPSAARVEGGEVFRPLLGELRVVGLLSVTGHVCSLRA